MGFEDLKNTKQKEKLDEELDNLALEDEGREVSDDALEGVAGGWPQIRTPLPLEPESKIV